MEKKLVIRLNDEVQVNSKIICIVSEDVGSMSKLTSWIMEYDRGGFDENGNVFCKNLNDFKVCQLKAVRLGLLPTPSIKSN